MTTEIIGYIASFLVAVSLLMVSIVKLRLINLAGSMVFVIYGFLIGSYPIVITNSFITLVNIYHLSVFLKKRTEGTQYILLSEERRYRFFDFIEANRADIMKYFPLFTESFAEAAFRNGWVYLCLKDFEPIGCAVFMPLTANEEPKDPVEREAVEYVREHLFPEQTLYIAIDYIVREYRDLGIDRKLFTSLARDTGDRYSFAVSITEQRNRKNIRFFRHNGYKLVRNFDGYELYMKPMSEQPSTV